MNSAPKVSNPLDVSEETVHEAIKRYNTDALFYNIVNTAVAVSYLGPSLAYMNEHTIAISRTAASIALILAEKEATKNNTQKTD